MTDFDVIIVGGGIAGSVAATMLAREGREVLLVERGAEVGSKNLSGGVFYTAVMEEVFPDFATIAPVERVITRNVLSFMTETSRISLDSWDARLAKPINAVSVLRATLDPWLAEQAEAAGATVMPGVKVDELLMEDGVVVGIRAGEDELRSHVVIAADGVNSFLAQGAGIRAKEPTQNLAVSVKSVIALPQDVLESRFALSSNDGAAWACAGDATSGVAGGGFLYTNKESLSVGVVLRLDSLIESGKNAVEIHDHFLAHPAIAPLLDGGELLEYGTHLTIEDGPAMSVHDISRPGLLIVGDAAGFTLNTGFAIRGMDFAAGSALAAARAVIAAFDASGADDPEAIGSQAALAYEKNIKDGFVGKDMTTYTKAPVFFMNDEIYTDLAALAGDVMFNIYRQDATPRRHVREIVRDTVKSSTLSIRKLISLVWRGMRSL